MKLSEYINSGILEEFCMGLLPEEEAKRVVAIAQKYPPIQEELDRIHDILEKADQESGVTPSAHVKSNLFESIKAEDSNREVGTIRKEPKPQTIKPAFNFKYAFAASLTGFLIACSFAIYLNLALNKTNQKISDLNAELMSNQTRLAVINKSCNNLVDISTNNQYNKIALNGLDNYPDASAVAFRSNNRLYVSIGTLPTPPVGMQYQFWAIVDGKPISAGLFDTQADKSMLTEMTDYKNATAFAISLEEMGGKESPTADKIYVIGEV